MVKNMRKKLGIASLVALMALATGPVAEAASFSSTFTGVRNGYKSRVWHDGGGSSQTTVRTSRCSVDHAQGNLDLTLWRHLRFQPDHNLGSRNARGCFTGTAHNAWGGIQPGDYYIIFGGMHSWQRITGNISVEY